MEFDEIVVKESPGLCRCCLSEGCYKDLATEYTWMNETEVYADMLMECFDISISQHNEGPNGPNRLICEVCITRLRDACNFKKQVLDSEKKFIDMVAKGQFKPKVLIYQAQMKSETNLDDAVPADDGEVEYLEEELNFGDDDLMKVSDDATDQAAVSEEITVATLPVKGKRGRPKKNATTVKTEKKAKVARLEEKPKTSKAVSKEFPDEDKMSQSADHFEKLAALRQKSELTKLVTIILENSTIMPFRWHGNKFMCFYCCCPFADSRRLKEHTREEHQEVILKNIFRSHFGRSSLKLDITETTCKRCDKELHDLEGFMDHALKEHHLKFNREASCNFLCFKLSDESMRCLECGQNFKFFGPLLSHVHKLHNKVKKFLCEICGQDFLGKNTMESHIKDTHSDTQKHCKKCKNVFSSHSALKTHLERVHRPGRLKCPKCPLVLGSKYLKKKHLALVHDVKSIQFNCELCSKIFTVQSKLFEHKQRVHLKEKKVTCEVCGFKVFNNDLLKRHMVKHDDSRPFECEFCKKAFQRKKTLEFHIRIHTNDRRYACNECGRAFVQHTSLKSHLRIHHTNTNENSSWT